MYLPKHSDMSERTVKTKIKLLKKQFGMGLHYLSFGQHSVN